MNLAITLPGLLVEILIIYNYWFSMLERRFSKKKSVIIFFCVHILNVIKCILLFDRVLLKALTTTVISLILLQVLFKDRWYKKLIVHIIYMLCIMCAEYSAMILAKYVYHHDSLDPTVMSTANYLWQATAYIFIFIFNIIALLLLKNKKLNPENRVTQFIFLYIAVQCLFVFMFTMFVFEYKITSTLMIVMILFVLLLSVIVGILIYRSVRYAVLKTAEAEFIKKESEIKDRHFYEIKEQYAEYRRLRHDFYNHIKIIDELNDPIKLKEYVNSIKKKFDAMESVTYCNNPTLDALLSLKKKEATQENITSDYSICDLKNIRISDFDLCTVVSNLLDNAITAAAKTDKKYVSLEITKKLGRLVIIVKNSSGEVSSDLRTTKEDSLNHGLGLKSVQAVASCYDGDSVFKYDNGEFVSIVTLCC